uniref:STING ligand-binding domain-containing protein n=1 Tax=Cuerna arida TaxID=1464854 RepID=A0A1B6GS67_9HEMI
MKVNSRYPQKPLRRKTFKFDILLFLMVLIFVFGYVPTITNTSRLHLCVLSLVCVSSIFLPYRIVVFLRDSVCLYTYVSVTDFLLKSVKTYNWRSIFCTCGPIIGLLLFHWLHHENDVKFQDLLSVQFSLLDIFICLLIPALGLYYQWDDCPLLESYRLEETSKFSGGSCMARGFFYGYLKIITPGLYDKIIIFQNENNLSDKEVPVKRLFVLIPSSTFIFDKLRKEADTVEPVEEGLDAHKQDRGLVLKRAYQNSMYKVRNKEKDRDYYVPLEGATPLKTFYETCISEPQYKEFKSEIISSFYYELERLINRDRIVKDMVELIYYDDENDPDIELAEVVKQRIKYLNRLNKSKNKKRKVL